MKRIGYIKLGVYINTKTAKLLVVSYPSQLGMDWRVDKGVTRKHPFFRGVTQSIYREGQGEYFLNRYLRGYEYLGEY